MKTIQSFLNVLVNLVAGLVLGVFRKNDFFDKQTQHLNRPGYILFLTAVVLVMILVIGAMLLYPVVT